MSKNGPFWPKSEILEKTKKCTKIEFSIYEEFSLFFELFFSKSQKSQKKSVFSVLKILKKVKSSTVCWYIATSERVSLWVFHARPLYAGAGFGGLPNRDLFKTMLRHRRRRLKK